MTPDAADIMSAFTGDKLNDRIDQIKFSAGIMGYHVNVLDDEFSPTNIDVEPDRLNVHTVDGVIKLFTIG